MDSTGATTLQQEKTRLNNLLYQSASRDHLGISRVKQDRKKSLLYDRSSISYSRKESLIMEEKAPKKAPAALLVTANVSEQNLSSPGKIYYNS